MTKQRLQGASCARTLPHYRRITKAELEQFRDAGWSLTAAAARLGISRGYMSTVAKRLGMDGRWPGSRTGSKNRRLAPEILDQMRKARDAGLSLAQAADEAGINRRTYGYRARRNGIGGWKPHATGSWRRANLVRHKLQQFSPEEQERYRCLKKLGCSASKALAVLLIESRKKRPDAQGLNQSNQVAGIL